MNDGRSVRGSRRAVTVMLVVVLGGMLFGQASFPGMAADGDKPKLRVRS